MKLNKFVPIMVLVGFLGMAESSFAANKITNEVFTVKAANDEWTPTGIDLKNGDVLLIQEPGNKIKIGHWAGMSDANGHPNKDGALEIKIGDGAEEIVGAHFFSDVKAVGQLKLRVYDTKYIDNSGQYEVKVTVIPGSMIPVAQTVQ